MYSGGHKKDFSNDNEMEGERDSSRFSDEDENGSSKKKNSSFLKRNLPRLSSTMQLLLKFG